jgi:sRNA-binding carbon storage regulator CsrA
LKQTTKAEDNQHNNQTSCSITKEAPKSTRIHNTEMQLQMREMNATRA